MHKLRWELEGRHVDVYVDDVWARGEIDGPVAQTRVTVASAHGEKADFIGTLSVEIRDYKTGQAAASGQCAVDGPGEYVIALPLKNGKLWYYIWVDGVGGWIAGGISTFAED